MNRFRRSGINILASAAGYAVPMLLNFISAPLLVSGLGLEGYGLQNLVGVITGYLALLDGGLDIPIIKLVAEYHSRRNVTDENRLLSTTLQLYLAIGAVGLVIAFAGSHFLATRVFELGPSLRDAGTIVFLLAGVGFLANVVTSWGRAVANGVQRYEVSNGIAVATSAVSIGIGLAVVYSGGGVVAYVGIRIAGHVVSAIAHVMAAHRLIPTLRISLGFHRDVLRVLRVYIASGLVLRFSGILSATLDRTFIGMWVGVAAVGAYSIPLLVVNSVVALLASMLHFTFPLASELYAAHGIEEVRALFARATRFTAAIAALVFPLLFVFGNTFLRLWVGPSAASSIDPIVLPVLVVAGLSTTVVATVASPFVVGVGKIRSFAVFAIAKGLAISAGYVLLIKPFGIRGAAMALLFGSVTEIVFWVWTIRRCLQGHVMTMVVASYAKPLLLGIAVLAAATLVHPLAVTWLRLSGAIVVITVAFALAVFAARIVTDSEMTAFSHALRAALRLSDRS